MQAVCEERAPGEEGAAASHSKHNNDCKDRSMKHASRRVGSSQHNAAHILKCKGSEKYHELTPDNITRSELNFPIQIRSCLSPPPAASQGNEQDNATTNEQHQSMQEQSKVEAPVHPNPAQSDP
jgi:hypothetical protein